MKLSELIVHVGDENVSFQNLLHGDVEVIKGKRDAQVKFFTSHANADALMREMAGIGPSPLVALVVWLPREKMPDFKGQNISVEQRPKGV